MDGRGTIQAFLCSWRDVQGKQQYGQFELMAFYWNIDKIEKCKNSNKSKRIPFKNIQSTQSQPAIHQPAKVESMRNLRSTPIASSSFLGINPKSRVRLSTQCQDTTVHKCKDDKHLKAVKRPFQMVQRFRTEDKESIYLKNMETLKKYVNNLTLKCGNLRKEEDIGKDSDNDAEAAKERKRFLMGQISFTQIDEERVMAQKKYLERFQYLSKSVPRVIRGGSPQGDSNNESRIFQCLRCIDRIYRLLREMEEAGYSLKNNRHVIDYCINGRLWLKRVFLHQSGEKKDAFKIAIKYLVNANCEETKTHFGEFAVKTRGEELRVVQDELVGLYQHLEHSMAQKKIMQVVNVANYIEGRLLQEGKILSRSLRCTQAPQDKMKLTKDLEGIEEKFGPMRNITRISRKRYDELNRTYDKLQTHG